MAHKTSLILNKHQVPNCLYREGCLHPANLDGYALLPAGEWDALMEKFPQHEERLKNHSLCIDGHILVQMQKDYRKGSPIFQYLEKYAIWDNGLDFDLFAKLHRQRWAAFARRSMENSGAFIFECAFLQDHITELMLFYERSGAEIVEYFKKLEESISVLNPFMIYLQQDSPEETINRIYRQRIHEPDGRPWGERVAEMIAGSPYGKTNALVGYAGLVEFFKRRKEMDLKVLSCLKIKHTFIDNNNYDWKEMQSRVFRVIENLIAEASEEA